MAEFPSFPLWTDAYLADTKHLTTIEHGAYLLLLICMWRSRGRLPNDDRLLARYAGLTASQWRRIKPVLLPFFTVSSDSITQSRLTRELGFVRQRSQRASDAARAKWRKNNNSDDASASFEQCSNDPPTPIPNPTPTPTPPQHSTNASYESERANPKPKRGTRLSTAWRPSTHDITFAEKEGLTNEEIERAVAEFIDYWVGVTGQKGVKLDWSATWRNNIRRIVERRRARNADRGARDNPLYAGFARSAAKHSS